MEVMGPSKAVGFDAQGQPTKAAIGFAGSQGVPVKALVVRTTPKGEYLFAVKKDPGRKTAVLLPQFLSELVGGLSFPKAMRWNATQVRFARPVRWLLALYGGKPVRFEFAGLTAGDTTIGHRFLSSGRPIRVRDFRSYEKALEKALRLSPRNAEALALRGFVLSAQNRIDAALNCFEQAIEVDSSLGNAWLGRGLCRIRQGKTEAGREDLLVAAALEPQRALLRSYLGKAYGDAGDVERAAKELALARKLDPRDPTAWLYLALLEEQNNQINDAVRDLEKSQELNDNRRVYRSRLLLDQDRAVRSANLANIYRDAGMFDVSVREAGRAVNDDYVNYSGHLFLAGSYNQIRDPNLINLRYETPAESEYLLANLLAPVGAGPDQRQKRWVAPSQAPPQIDHSRIDHRAEARAAVDFETG